MVRLETIMQRLGNITETLAEESGGNDDDDHVRV